MYYLKSVTLSPAPYLTLSPYSCHHASSFFNQTLISDHYHEDAGLYDEAITEFMELREVTSSTLRIVLVLDTQLTLYLYYGTLFTLQIIIELYNQPSDKSTYSLGSLVKCFKCVIPSSVSFRSNSFDSNISITLESEM